MPSSAFHIEGRNTDTVFQEPPISCATLVRSTPKHSIHLHELINITTKSNPMSKIISVFAFLFFSVLVSTGFCNQPNLDAERSQKLQVVLEAIQQADHTKLASCIPGMSEDEASKILKTLAEHWGEGSKLVQINGVLGDKLNKGSMKIIANWGTRPTQTGCWMELSNTANKSTVLRIGLLFPHESSEVCQFVAAEWEVTAVSP